MFIGHPSTADSSPTLVMWDPAKGRSASFRLPFPWFVGGRLLSGTEALGNPPPSEVREVADLGGGRILLVVRVTDARWKVTGSRQEQREAYDQLLDLYYVVVDVRNRTVVAELLVDKVSSAPIDFQPEERGSFSLDQSLDSVRIWMVRPALSVAPPTH